MTEGQNLTTVEKVLFLKSVDLFEHAAIEELGRIVGVTQEVRFAAGETIYREGDAVEAIYIILKGRAEVQNRARITREVGEKNAIGVLAALDTNAALRTVTAKEPVHALKLSVEDFEDILSADFELVKAVFRVVARHIREGT